MSRFADRKRYIYALSDPRTGEIRYIGVTTNPRMRLYGHLSTGRKIRTYNSEADKDNWIAELRSLGLCPSMSILESHGTSVGAINSERLWISVLGSRLLNRGIGGDLGGKKASDPKDRILNQCIPEPFSGCWLWTGALTKKGYGQHRLSFTAFKGPIPAGLQLDHKCRVRSCVNPDHLEPVTLVENVKRGEVGRANREKTSCPKGHPYGGITESGERYCKECRNSARREKRKKSGAIPRFVQIVCNGESHYLKEWERITGIDHTVISRRLNSGWPVERALFEKPTKSRIQSPETIAKRVAKLVGQKRTPEQIDRIQRARNPHLYVEAA